MALLAGLGSLLGGLSNTNGARTGTQSSTGTTSNTGTSTPTFSGLQQGLQSTAANALTSRINGNINTTPMATAGTEAINQTYKGIGDSLQQSLASRGFGNSGASGTAALQTEVGRAGAVGNLQNQLQSTALQQQQQAIQTAAGMAYASPGVSTSGTSAFGNSGSYTNPGSMAAGTLSGGLTSLLGGANMGTLLSALQAGG